MVIVLVGGELIGNFVKAKCLMKIIEQHGEHANIVLRLESYGRLTNESLKLEK